MAQVWEFHTNRSWKRALKGSLIGLLAVPLFHFILNTDFSDPDYGQGLFKSVRIGSEVVVVNLLLFATCYYSMHRFRLAFLFKIKDPIQFRFALGFLGMTLGLMLASFVESRLGHRTLNIQGYVVGLFLGSITYLAFMMRSAYREAQEFNLRLRAESAESHLNVLKNQMQPHFLFNS